MSLHLHLLGLKPAPMITPPLSAIRRHKLEMDEERDSAPMVSKVPEMEDQNKVMALFGNGLVLTNQIIMKRTGMKETRTRNTVEWLVQTGQLCKAWKKNRNYFALDASDFPMDQKIDIEPKSMFCKGGYHRFTGPYRVIETRKNGKLINTRIECEACAVERDKRVKARDKREVFKSKGDTK